MRPAFCCREIPRCLEFTREKHLSFFRICRPLAERRCGAGLQPQSQCGDRRLVLSWLDAVAGDRRSSDTAGAHTAATARAGPNGRASGHHLPGHGGVVYLPALALLLRLKGNTMADHTVHDKVKLGRLLGISIVALALLFFALAVLQVDRHPRTDDATVRANAIAFAPEVEGRLEQLLVK